MKYGRFIQIVVGINFIAMALVSCTEGPTIPKTFSMAARPLKSSQYPRLALPEIGSVLTGTAATEANRNGAYREVATGDSMPFKLMDAEAHLLSERVQVTKLGSNQNFDLAAETTIDSAAIWDSGTYPVLGSGESYIAGYADFVGDQIVSTADYKSPPLGQITGSWVSLPNNPSLGTLYYTDATQSWWYHQETHVTMNVGCGHDLWARGTHDVWFAGHTVTIGGTFDGMTISTTVTVMNPSVHAQDANVESVATGVACPEDEYDQNNGSDVGGGDGSCPLEDQYMWLHWDTATGEYDYMGDVCIDDGMITII